MSNPSNSEHYPDSLWTRAGGMVGEADPGFHNRVCYQVALRALGAYLDERQAQRINLLEAAESFAVRYQEQRNSPDSTSALLAHTELVSLHAQLEQKRKRLTFGLGRSGKGTYENVLRALGYELDEVGAYSILVDEIDEGMVVTYQFLKPTEGFQARKRMVILGADAMHAVMADAQARRERRKKGVLTLLAG